jgi:Holliday junction DNA helicase RuvA
MIVQLTGRLVHKEPGSCVIDVGGVGYGVVVSLHAFASLPESGSSVCMPVHTHVREDQLLLYGFQSAEERSLFRKLIAVGGIGPKTAMAVLSGLPPPDLVEAISRGDSARLSTIPGIGRKTAERMIVELRDMLAREPRAYAGGEAAAGLGVREGAISALMNLGYARPVADGALRRSKIPDGAPIEEVIKVALRELCRV